ncbi:hypothetical protein A0H81_11652 [Grifola frondosa]|uniref:Uncharacterized protein n=1 Tax=Grifola frondosa TaxID=5627 RepID=A0A1C7LZX6_GRIFR|nr:hypothetical protein A0H81_11652 [Grifola frondosa]
MRLVEHLGVVMKYKTRRNRSNLNYEKDRIRSNASCGQDNSLLPTSSTEWIDSPCRCCPSSLIPSPAG